MKSNIVTIKEVQEYYQAFYQSLPYGFDDFYEGEILGSTLYTITDEELIKAVFSINLEGVLTSLYLLNEFSHEYSKVFDWIINTFEIKGIIGVTNDTFLMSEIVSRDYQTIKQACNYRYTVKHQTSIHMEKASHNELAEIEEKFTDFLDNYNELIDKGMLYIYKLQGEMIALSNMNQHAFDKNSYSIGIMVLEAYRGKGIARNCLRFIGNKLLSESKIVNAGCWYYNHSSKKALIGAKFTQSNTIFRVGSCHGL